MPKAKPNSEESQPVEVTEIFDTIENPRERFANSYSEAYDELVWRSFRVLFERGRIEAATTRELNMLLGTSVDKIQDLAVSRLPDDQSARLERHRQAQEKLQEFMRLYGLTRGEALDFLKKEAPTVFELIVAPTQGEKAS